MKNKKLPAILIGLVIGLSILGLAYIKNKQKPLPTTQEKTTVATVNVPDKTFTVAQLAEFNGSDTSKPIYIGMNGLVYDVTEGRKYYEVGAGYHWLAGKDSSTDLNLIGGDIIKRKYPVVGKLIQ